MIILKILLTATLPCVAFLFGYEIVSLYQMLIISFRYPKTRTKSTLRILLLCLQVKIFRETLLKASCSLISMLLILSALIK